MRIKSEYTILTECIERGISYGCNRAYKHSDTPTPETIKTEIYHGVVSEIAEYFLFDEESE